MTAVLTDIIDSQLSNKLEQIKSFELHYRDNKCWIDIGEEEYELREFTIISTSHSGTEVKIRIGKSNLDQSVTQWYDAIIKIDFCYSLLKRDSNG